MTDYYRNWDSRYNSRQNQGDMDRQYGFRNERYRSPSRGRQDHDFSDYGRSYDREIYSGRNYSRDMNRSYAPGNDYRNRNASFSSYPEQQTGYSRSSIYGYSADYEDEDFEEDYEDNEYDNEDDYSFDESDLSYPESDWDEEADNRLTAGSRQSYGYENSDRRRY